MFVSAPLALERFDVYRKGEGVEEVEMKGCPG